MNRARLPIYAIMVASILLLTVILAMFSQPIHEKYPELGDVVPPSISLLSPSNGTFIHPGNPVILNISDEALRYVNVTVDNSTHPQTYPWRIATDSWSEGRHMVGVEAVDESGNIGRAYYVFFVDLTPPAISLLSPLNGSAMESGTDILINITDENLVGANYSLDGGIPQCLPSPFRISTEWWTEGNHTLKVSALDRGGNSASSTFEFTIDNKEALIKLISPSTRVIRSGTPLIFDIEESTLVNITYSINGGEPVPWSAPWVIGTSNWSDGTYSIAIMAKDKAGHSVIRTYTIDVDDTPPLIETPDIKNITVYVYLDERNYTSWKNSEKIGLSISDAHLKDVFYSINEGSDVPLQSPYVLDPAMWRGGNVSITVRATDVVGNRAEVSFRVNLSLNLTIYMGKGWSDISIPLLLDTYSIREVFSVIEGTENGSYDKLESYDGTWHSFDPNRPDQFNAWKEFSPYYGLTIDITSKQANFTVSGELPRNFTINLTSSHPNFVPYPLMKPSRVDVALAGIPWYKVQRWDWRNQRYVDMKGDDIMIPGYAYWIYVSYDSAWSVGF